MQKKIATCITWIFSPLLIPTYVTFLLFYSGFYFSMLSWPMKRILIISMIIITFVMPVITLAIARLGKRKKTGTSSFDQKIAMVFIAVYFLMGAGLLGRIPIYSIFRIILLVGAILIILYLLISFRWKISIHLVALGGALGLIIALSLRIGVNSLALLSTMILVSGITGSALLVNEKQSLMGTVAGFTLGYLIFFSTFYFV
ncbi:MAG: hypothetical protein FWG22_03185 [Prolixibacteraceae bacterium]|nr:hypothetical protein [Prolixibacteraceae bacterium]